MLFRQNKLFKLRNVFFFVERESRIYNSTCSPYLWLRLITRVNNNKNIPKSSIAYFLVFHSLAIAPLLVCPRKYYLCLIKKLFSAWRINFQLLSICIGWHISQVIFLQLQLVGLIFNIDIFIKKNWQRHTRSIPILKYRTLS